MSTPIDRIKRGLAAAGHKSSFASLESVVGCPLTFENLGKTVHTILNRRIALQKQAEAFTKKLAAFEERTRAELSETGKTREARGDGSFIVQDLWGDDKRKIELNKRVSAQRKAMAAEGEENRSAALKAINEAIGRLDTVRNLWTDAPAFLGRSVIGESALRIYKQNLEGVPPKQVENNLKQAIAAGDRVLVAACLDTIDSMDSDSAKQVNVDRNEAAALALGEEYIKARHHIAAADLSVLQAQIAEAEIAGRSTAQLKERMVLKKREVLAWAGEDFDPDKVMEDDG